MSINYDQIDAAELERDVLSLIRWYGSMGGGLYGADVMYKMGLLLDQKRGGDRISAPELEKKYGLMDKDFWRYVR